MLEATGTCDYLLLRGFEQNSNDRKAVRMRSTATLRGEMSEKLLQESDMREGDASVKLVARRCFRDMRDVFQLLQGGGSSKYLWSQSCGAQLLTLATCLSGSWLASIS